MKDILKIAYRNISRNKRRSALTISIIVLGISIYSFTLGYLDGFINQTYERSISMTGEIRIIHPDFEIKEKTFDLTANIPLEDIREKIQIEAIRQINGRIKFGAMLFFEEKDRQTLGYGMEKSDLDNFDLEKSIIKGEVSEWEISEKILIGEKLASKINVEVGESVTLMTSTQWGSVSAFNYEVGAIFNHRIGMFNEMFVIPLSSAQYLLDMEESVSEIVIFAHNQDDIHLIKNEIDKKVDVYTVQAWDEIGMNKIMLDWMPVSKMIMIIIFGGLSCVGIINTMMMVVFERKREIGLLESQGMGRFQVLLLLLTEGIIMGIIGTIIGVTIGTGVTYYFEIYGLNFGEQSKDMFELYNMESIIYTPVSLKNTVEASIIGVLFAFLGTLFPIVSIIGKKPSELMKA